MHHKNSCPNKPIVIEEDQGLKYVNDECKKSQYGRNWTITDHGNQQ
jgi:hypothetical protein